MNRTILTVISSMVFSCQLVLAETGVKLGTLEEIANYPVRSAPATALSINDAEIAVEIAGRVAEVHVRVGDVREKGATLVSLDCGTYDFRLAAQRAKLGVSKARIGLAERRLARTKTLAAKQSVSDEILDERVSELEILKAERAEINANYTLAKQDVNRCTIVAAFPTLVTERIAAVGEYLNPGDAVLQVIDVENIEVSAQIQFGDLASIEKSAELWFEHADKAYPVAVRATLNALNSATRDQEMRLNFTEDSALPGAAGQLYWRDKRPHLPGNLLVQRGNELGLFVVENEVAKFVPITDAAPGRAVAVNFPLDTRIVIEGFYSLSDGDTLTSQDRAMR